MPKISKAALIKLQKALRTDEAIGRNLGISRWTVYSIRSAYGIPSSFGDNPRRNEKIVALYKQGMYGTDIAKKIGLTAPMVYKIINDAGAGKSKRGGAKMATAPKPGKGAVKKVTIKKVAIKKAALTRKPAKKTSAKKRPGAGKKQK
jgi:DNA-binding CsgD family transcriptional regulator